MAGEKMAAAEIEEIRQDAYKTLMTVAWNFDYTPAVEKVVALYDKAKIQQWDAARDIDWSIPVDPSNPQVGSRRSPYIKMPFFKRLSKSQQEAFTAHSTAQLLSQFLHGEQGALITAAVVTHSTPHYDAKMYASTQTIDESRHVEVYLKYIEKLAEVYPMTPWLKALIDATVQSDRFEKCMIGMNMIVESLALGSFHNMYRDTTCPLLKSITYLVMRDESRHVAFGNIYLGKLIPEMHQDDKEDLAQFAYDAVKILVDGTQKEDPNFIKVLENSNIDPEDFRKGIIEAREEGITQEVPAGNLYLLRDLMMPAIVRVGLVTKRTREMFEADNIQVYDDTAVLEALEGDNFEATMAAEDEKFALAAD